MQSDLTCDYEGTDLEQFIGGVISGDLVLDSIYVEYLLLDSAEQFIPGCPDPVVIETVQNVLCVRSSHLLRLWQLPSIQSSTTYLMSRISDSSFS